MVIQPDTLIWSFYHIHLLNLAFLEFNINNPQKVHKIQYITEAWSRVEAVQWEMSSHIEMGSFSSSSSDRWGQGWEVIQ